MTAAPTISILMPVKDGLPYIQEAMRSLLIQDFQDFEIVVVDDGSADGTPDWLESLGEKRLRLVRNGRNLGVTASLLKGLEHCAGAFVARMDADDACDPTRLWKQMQAFGDGVAMVGTGAMAFGDREFHWRAPIEDGDIRAYLMFDCPFPHSSMMMRREEMAKHGLTYDAGMPQAQDYDLWTRTSAKSKLRGIDEPLILYRLHPGGVTAVKSEGQRRCADRIRKWALKEFVGYELPTTAETAMRRLAGVYAHRFAQTVDELVESWEIAKGIEAAAVRSSAPEAFLREVDARWHRVLNWATPAARAAFEERA